MLHLLLEIPQRKIYFIDQASSCASFLIVDEKIGGILVNAPGFSKGLLEDITAVCTPKFLFLPSHLGATDADIDEWKNHTSLEVIAHEIETPLISSPVDISINHKTKLSRTIDFVPMAGRTPGSCALYLKNLPGILFFGPILSIGNGAWPDLIPQANDFSFESRMFGALGLKDIKFEYAFTDDFSLQSVNFGDSACQAICDNIDAFFSR